MTPPSGRGGRKVARRQYPLRLPAPLYDAIERWAAAELRSMNNQMEVVLTEAAVRAGHLKVPSTTERDQT